MLDRIKKITAIFKKSRSFFSEIPHLKKYLLLSVLLTILFTIINFPFDTVFTNKIRNLKNRNFQIADISGLRFSIFSESKIDLIKIVFSNGTDLIIKKSIINPSINPFRIYKKRYSGDFQLSNIQLTGEKFSLITSLNGNIIISMSKNNLPDNGFMNILSGRTFVTLDGVEIPTPMGKIPVDIKEIVLNTIELKVQFKNEKLIIEKAQCRGTDLNLMINGNVELKNIPGNSRLNLSLNIDSNSKILDKYKDILSGYKSGDQIKFEITGSLSRPQIKILK